MIKLDSISKIYFLSKIRVLALQKISLAINGGEFVAIMGPSGSGKSTLMNIMGCLDKPTQGSYRLEGTVVSKMGDKQLAKIRNEKIGFVFQTFNLLSYVNVLENVELPMIYGRVSLKERKRIALESIKKVGLAHRVTHKPNELSGGERQRVAIARALVRHPSIILADEPTGNLDSKSGAKIMSIFQSLNQQGITIMLVTHEMDIAQYARRIIHLKDGLMVSDEENKDSLRIPDQPENIFSRRKANDY